jgi:hypothetical protein
MLIAQALLMAFSDIEIKRFSIGVNPFPTHVSLPGLSDEQCRDLASPMHFEWSMKPDKDMRMKIKKLCRVKIPRKMKKALKSYDNNKDCRKTKRVMRIIRIEREVLKQMEKLEKELERGKLNERWNTQ